MDIERSVNDILNCVARVEERLIGVDQRQTRQEEMLSRIADRLLALDHRVTVLESEDRESLVVLSRALGDRVSTIEQRIAVIDHRITPVEARHRQTVQTVLQVCQALAIGYLLYYLGWSQ